MTAFSSLGGSEEADWSKALPKSVSVTSTTCVLKSDLASPFVSGKILIQPVLSILGL